jgi:hypothetical protein
VNPGEQPFARLFQRASGTWPEVAQLQRPDGEAPWYPNAMALRGSVAMLSGQLGTHVYRSSDSGWASARRINLLEYSWQGSSDVRIGDRYVVQSGVNSTLGTDVSHVFRERADHTFEHVAILALQRAAAAAARVGRQPAHRVPR